MADILFSIYIDRPTDALSIIKENWIRKFINRHKQLKTKYIRKYNYQRAIYENFKIINN